MGPRWLLYSYDALGLGHVRRMLSLARAVLAERPDLSALLVTCSPQVDALPVPPGLDYIKLPSARKVGDGAYEPRTLRLDPVSLKTLRSGLLVDTARGFEPDLFLVDKSPAGLMDELLETLPHVRGRARLVLGWRDILDAPGRVSAEWRERDTLQVIERYYDEVWVYGDPAVFDLREAYGLPDWLAERVRYLGYLSPRVDPVLLGQARAAMARNGEPVAVVTAGGGEGGETLIGRYFEAVRRKLLPRDLRSVVVTGPFMAEAAQRQLRAEAPPGVRLKTFLPGLEHTLAAADVVISLAGYNTVCEVLGAGTPAVLVPRLRHHREEQRMRAERLSALGLVEHLDMDALTPRALTDAVSRALGRGRRRCTEARLDGLDRVAAHLRDLLPVSAEANA